jgi:hypothetical protein
MERIIFEVTEEQQAEIKGQADKENRTIKGYFINLHENNLKRS